jgi:Xaa-Pro aminopeptidase
MDTISNGNDKETGINGSPACATRPGFPREYEPLFAGALPGFVFTIEPGIYFIPALIDRWHSGKRSQEYIHYDRIAPYMHVGGVRDE